MARTKPTVSRKAMSSVPWRNRIVGYGEEDASQLLANPANFRIHPRNQQAALEGSLDTLGWIQNCVLNRTTGFVLDGHARAALAISRGEKVPCLYVELTPEEEALAIATLDAITGMAGTDQALLDELIASIRGSELGMDLGPGLDALLESMSPDSSLQAQPGEDDVPPLDDAPVSRAGDRWQMGPHRLLCGDCTNADNVARLLDPGSGIPQPLLMVTDEPYGVSLDPSWRQDAGLQSNTRQSGQVANDDRFDWSAAYALFPGDVAYLWHAGIHAAEVARGLRSCRFQIRAQIVWKKQRIVISRGAYHWAHEPAWYSVREGKSAHWRGDRKQSTVWEVDNLVTTNRSDDSADPENSITGHGTQKPVELFRRPTLNHTLAGEAIYDPFLGSGSALIAAELTGRICYGLEILPGYCDVIIRRWQNLTGRDAILDGHGATFEHVKRGRRMEAEDAIKEEALAASCEGAVDAPAALSVKEAV